MCRLWTFDVQTIDDNIAVDIITKMLWMSGRQFSIFKAKKYQPNNTLYYA